MNEKDIAFLKTLILKLDSSINAERGNINVDELMLIFDFTDKNRAECITKAFDILNEIQNNWQNLKEWLIFAQPKNSNDDFLNGVYIAYRDIIAKMQELEGEDE